MLECGYFRDMTIFHILYPNHQKVGNPKKVEKSLKGVYHFVCLWYFHTIARYAITCDIVF